MSNPVLSPSSPEPGRQVRPPRTANPHGWMRWLPGLQTLRGYEWAWLRHDIVAGLVVVANEVVQPCDWGPTT